MIRELGDHYHSSNQNLKNAINASDYVIGMICDACNGHFLFAAMDFRYNPTPLSGTAFQHILVKFCPFCGARNTSNEGERKKL